MFDRGYVLRVYDYVCDILLDVYEIGKNKFGSIIEILGWYKVVDDDYSYFRNYFFYDVIVGNIRYVWY